jgi:DNA polymerase-3 subunit gamma/tau
MAKKATKAEPTPPPPAAAPEPPVQAARLPGAYTVVARRYRPGQFSELVGQEAIAQALTNAIETSRVAHAYLFTGARGVGKTSTARILAKALNCVRGPTPSPCGVCDACQAIAAGEDVDVLEIDGASNNKVEEVRELRQNVQYRPQRSRFKIYIIDEVHMLSTSAFNALLKTLEEPPPHVKFIFATTEVNKIPITILSRCQRYDFGTIRTSQIKERLRQIVAREQMEADDDALLLLAKRGAGSMRDAQSLLDQALAFATGKLTADAVHRLLGTASDERLAVLAGCVLERDPAKVLMELDRLLTGSVQPGELIEQLIDLWRQLLLLKTLGEQSPLVELAEGLKKMLAPWTGRLATDTLLHGLDLLLSAKGRLRLTTHGRVVLEMTLLRLAQLADLVPLAELSRQLANGAAPPEGRLVMPPTARITTPPPPTASPGGATEETGMTAAARLVPFTPENLPAIWSAVSKAGGLALQGDFLKITSKQIVPPNTLVVTFPKGCAKERDRCQQPERVERMEHELKKLTGQTVRIKFELSLESAPASTVAVPSAKQRVAQEPLVKAAMEQLGAELMQFDQDFGLDDR